MSLLKGVIVKFTVRKLLSANASGFCSPFLPAEGFEGKCCPITRGMGWRGGDPNPSDVAEI